MKRQILTYYEANYLHIPVGLGIRLCWQLNVSLLHRPGASRGLTLRLQGPRSSLSKIDPCHPRPRTSRYRGMCPFGHFRFWCRRRWCSHNVRVDHDLLLVSPAEVYDLVSRSSVQHEILDCEICCRKRQHMFDGLVLDPGRYSDRQVHLR